MSVLSVICSIMFYAIDNIGGYEDEQGLWFLDPMVGGSFIQNFFSGLRPIYYDRCQCYAVLCRAYGI